MRFNRLTEWPLVETRGEIAQIWGEVALKNQNSVDYLDEKVQKQHTSDINNKLT